MDKLTSESGPFTSLIVFLISICYEARALQAQVEAAVSTIFLPSSRI
jgi:hypothetical protein